MLRSCGRIIVAFLPLYLAGCETSSQQRPVAAARVTTTVTVPEALTVAPAAPIYELPPPVPIIVPETNYPAVQVFRIWPTNWVNVWIPLETWGRYNGISNITQHGPNQSAAFDLQTSNGVMSLKIGGRVARCNGLDCWLAYTPQMIKGMPYIHSLDAQKNLQPFLTPAAYQFKTNRIIVLDAGHGGKDSGARDINSSSNLEKVYTLDWAIRVARLLATNGWRVVMTRTTDLDVSLGERVAMADRAKADLFVSLHFNSGTPNRDLAGIETYCVTPTGMPSSLVRTYEDDKKQIFPNNAFDEQNYQIGYRLHRELVQSLGAADRGLRRARFMTVLRGQHRPAVLIEGGYLSNPAEARRIETADYREKLAEAVAKALD